MIFSQTKSNNQKFIEVFDSAFVKIKPGIERNVSLFFENSEQYPEIKSRFIYLLNENKFNVTETNQEPNLYYKIDSVELSYQNLERDGLFGSFNVERMIKFNSTVNFRNLNGKLITEKIAIKEKDTIEYDSIEEIEKYSYGFLKAEHPQEPFLKTVWDPVLLIGAAAASVIVFFFVRSN